MKLLSFEVKRNLKKPPRIYVKSLEQGIIYGSFTADNPEKFEGWSEMKETEIIELKHYIHNLKAVNAHLGDHVLTEQSDYRLRLPLSFSDAIDEISTLCYRSSLEFDIYEPIISSIVQQLKITIAKLSGDNKAKALTILDQIGLAEYKKIDHSQKIQAIFSEILSIHNKSEKLHHQAKTIFKKDKSYSPKAIESMASGDTNPSKWLVACAIGLLLEEKPKIIKAILTEDDFFILLAKQLLDNLQRKQLLKIMVQYKLEYLENRINAYEAKE